MNESYADLMLRELKSENAELKRLRDAWKQFATKLLAEKQNESLLIASMSPDELMKLNSKLTASVSILIAHAKESNGYAALLDEARALK